MVVDSDPKAAITESFRTVRTNLEYLPETEHGKVVLVTSYRPNEGKTFCSVNLGAILAKAGKARAASGAGPAQTQGGQGLNMTHPQGLSNLLVGKVGLDGGDRPRIERLRCDVLRTSAPMPPNWC